MEKALRAVQISKLLAWDPSCKALSTAYQFLTDQYNLRKSCYTAAVVTAQEDEERKKEKSVFNNLQASATWWSSERTYSTQYLSRMGYTDDIANYYQIVSRLLVPSKDNRDWLSAVMTSFNIAQSTVKDLLPEEREAIDRHLKLLEDELQRPVTSRNTAQSLAPPTAQADDGVMRRYNVYLRSFHLTEAEETWLNGASIHYTQCQ